MTRLGGVLGSPFSPRASWRKSCRLPRTGCHRHTPSLGAYLNSSRAGFHSRFGRGRGKELHADPPPRFARVNKATIGSSDADLRTAAGLGIEPVSNSLVGTCLPPPRRSNDSVEGRASQKTTDCNRFPAASIHVRPARSVV